MKEYGVRQIVQIAARVFDKSPDALMASRKGSRRNYERLAVFWVIKQSPRNWSNSFISHALKMNQWTYGSAVQDIKILLEVECEELIEAINKLSSALANEEARRIDRRKRLKWDLRYNRSGELKLCRVVS